MKLAVLGKGGAGKTTLVSLLARVLSERGLMVLAVDLDANPGLGISLGIGSSDVPLPEEAVEERPDSPYGWGLARHLTAAEAVRRYAIPVADKIVFLGFGNNAGLDTPVTRYLSAVRHVACEFEEPGWVIVADLAAGPTNPFEGYARFADLALVVVESTPSSVLAARGLLGILVHDRTPAELVLNKADSDADVLAIAPDLVPFGRIPRDEEVRRLERRGSLAGLSAQSPALEAVAQLVSKIGISAEGRREGKGQGGP